jgi:hypothetical protein
MKLYELVGVKKFYDSNLEDVLGSMTKTGYKESGRGAFGVVMKGASGVVKFWIKDAAYDDFINYISKHPSKYFPKLLSKPKELSSFFMRSREFPEKIRFVRMEHLDHLERPQDSRLIHHIFTHLKQDEKNEDLLASLTDVNLERLKHLVGDPFKFCEEIKKLIDATIKGGNYIDIHSGNLMLRNGELVVTDPIANSADLEDAEKIAGSLEDLKKEYAITGRSKASHK